MFSIAFAAALMLMGCSSAPGAPDTPTTAPPDTHDAHPLDEQARMRVAQELRSQLPCTDSDTWRDDMSFYDAMNGFDCFDDVGASFIRVYAQNTSPPQVLPDWDGTYGDDRGLAVGAHWFVIGPRDVVASLSAPKGELRFEERPTRSEVSPQDDFVTTCVRYGATEAERLVRDPARGDPDAEQYAALFPGVASAVATAVEQIGLPAVRAIRESDRRLAALSPAGPAIKRACATAGRASLNTTQPIGEPR